MTGLDGCRRILVVGPCGAGKSTLARELGARTGLPVIHLDQHYWRAGWEPLDDAAWEAALAALLARPEWIIDGAYVRTLPRRLAVADAAIHLDLPRALCHARVLKRIVTGFGRTRFDLAEGCPEKLDLEFLQWVWTWHRDQRPSMLRAMANAPSHVRIVTLHTRRQVAELLRDSDTITGA